MEDFPEVSQMCDKALECEYEWTYRKARSIEDRLSLSVDDGGYHPSKRAAAQKELEALSARLRVLNSELFERCKVDRPR